MAPVHIRDATVHDVPGVASIGAPGMLAQYAGLVDPRAVQAAVEQLYDPPALAACISRCTSDARAEFLVAERDEAVVAFLHFDAFGPEPELHRLYCSPAARGGGVGSRLIDELHDRLENPSGYMLLVVEGNDRAVAFYERHGLHVEATVDGQGYYSERTGVNFPDGTGDFRLMVMRRGLRAPSA